MSVWNCVSSDDSPECSSFGASEPESIGRVVNRHRVKTLEFVAAEAVITWYGLALGNRHDYENEIGALIDRVPSPVGPRN
jgi:hypothetical protein